MAGEITYQDSDNYSWEFARQADGSVTIIRYLGPDIGRITFTGTDWATVVAAVSKSGPTQMAKDVAAEFHNTNFAEFEESASVQQGESK